MTKKQLQLLKARFESANKRNLEMKDRISFKEFLKCFEDQGRRCPICKKKLNLNALNKWHFDHDHSAKSSKRFRGILHAKCNTKLHRNHDHFYFNSLPYLFWHKVRSEGFEDAWKWVEEKVSKMRSFFTLTRDFTEEKRIQRRKYDEAIAVCKQTDNPLLEALILEREVNEKVITMSFVRER